jgi:hypothetical protein
MSCYLILQISTSHISANAVSSGSTGNWAGVAQLDHTIASHGIVHIIVMGHNTMVIVPKVLSQNANLQRCSVHCGYHWFNLKILKRHEQMVIYPHLRRVHLVMKEFPILPYRPIVYTIANTRTFQLRLFCLERIFVEHLAVLSACIVCSSNYSLINVGIFL